MALRDRRGGIHRRRRWCSYWGGRGRGQGRRPRSLPHGRLIGRHPIVGLLLAAGRPLCLVWPVGTAEVLADLEGEASRVASGLRRIPAARGDDLLERDPLVWSLRA